MSWPHIAIGDVVRVARSSIGPEEISNGTTYVGLEHIDSSGEFVEVKVVDAGELSSSKFRFTSQHVLFGKLRPYLKKIARPNFEGVCSTDILPLEPTKGIDRDYLFHVLRRQSFVDEVSSLCAGANLPRISPKVLTSMQIPVPSLPEQRRIAAVLDKADALRAKRRESIAKLDQLLQSVFLDMFGDPNDESGTDLTPFLTVFVDASAGHVKTKQDDYLKVGALPIVDQGQALIGGYSNDLEVKSGAELPVIIFGDHTRCVKYVDFDFGVGADGVKVLRPRSEDDPLFLYWWLRLRRIPSAGYSRHFKFLKEAMIRCPAVDEQRRFGHIARCISARLDAMEAARNNADQLFLSLQSRAFAGTL